MDRGSATALAPHLTRTLSGLETIASGTPVIVGDGYDVEQPPPATTLTVNVWATGAIRVIRGPILELGRQVDRSVNDMWRRAVSSRSSFTGRSMGCRSSRRRPPR